MSCVTFKAAILRRPLNASPAMPKIYGSRGQTAVFRPRRINPCVNLCIKLTENASDASVFSVSLKRSFLTQVYPQIYFHSVPADKSRIPGIGKYCNTATAVSAVVFELDTNTNFEVKRISHKRRKCSGFILTATKVRFCITDTVHFDWNQCSKLSESLFIYIGIRTARRSPTCHYCQFSVPCTNGFTIRADNNSTACPSFASFCLQ